MAGKTDWKEHEAACEKNCEDERKRRGEAGGLEQKQLGQKQAAQKKTEQKQSEQKQTEPKQSEPKQAEQKRVTHGYTGQGLSGYELSENVSSGNEPLVSGAWEKALRREEISPVERFLRYVKIDTQSDEDAQTAPSTAKQHELARLLEKELSEMGAAEITYDREHCYVYATVPASEGYESCPTLGFIAHMDTSPAVTGADVRPRIVERYDGGDILLNPERDIVMRIADFPELEKLKGQDLIVTDGLTLLGADDKAGVSEIMTMATCLLTHPEVCHGRIRLGFTPDEEIGRGPDHFDLELFGADYAYTVDGGALGELEFENFNAAGAKLTVNGISTHPGSAKGKMKNAILIAQEFQSMLPAFENPIYTEGYEGFYHLDGIRGNVEQTVCDYIIRDHDRELFEKKKAFFQECADFLNRKYGEGTVCPVIKDSYYNMREILEPHMHLVENAKRAMEELGIRQQISPIRGGTDGARLSFQGLPCPNLCTGGANYHSRFEYASVQGMEMTTRLLIRLAERYGDKRNG